MPISVEIWSDVVCPWCYIGKRRFEAALERFERADEVTVLWRSFELDPEAPVHVEGSAAERLAAKYGMSVERATDMHAQMTEMAAAEGLEFRFDRSRGGNTFDAHRLIHLAATSGHQAAAKERLMRGYFTEGEAIADPETLVRLVAEVGVDADEARDVLAGDRFADDVREDELLATRLGIQGVPFFVLDRRLGVSGAQPPEVLVGALERASVTSQRVSYSVLPAGEAFWRPSNQMGVLNTDLAKQLGATDMGARFWRLKPGQASTKHRHRMTVELYVVIEGEGRIRIDDDLLSLPRMSALLVQPDSVRQVFNDTDEDALWLVFGAPSEGANTLEMSEETLAFLYPDGPKALPPELAP